MTSIQLSCGPAFGFEIASCNAEDFYTKTYEKDSTDIKIKMYIKQNLKKILGYIPIVGSLVGILRILQLKEIDPRETNRVNHLVRGSIELLSLGFSLVILDLFLTATRAIRASLPRSKAVPNTSEINCIRYFKENVVVMPLSQLDSLPEGWEKHKANTDMEVQYSEPTLISDGFVRIPKGSSYYTFEGKIALGYRGSYDPPRDMSDTSGSPFGSTEVIKV